MIDGSYFISTKMFLICSVISFLLGIIFQKFIEHILNRRIK